MSLFDTFATDCAYIVSEIGRDVVFRGATVKAVCSEPLPSDMLTIGGFSGSGSGQSFKFLRATYSAQPPTEGELVDFNGKRWVIATVDSRPLGPWFSVSCKPWDA